MKRGATRHAGGGGHALDAAEHEDGILSALISSGEHVKLSKDDDTEAI